jgi:hypothetical protein
MPLVPENPLFGTDAGQRTTITVCRMDWPQMRSIESCIVTLIKVAFRTEAEYIALSMPLHEDSLL